WAWPQQPPGWTSGGFQLLDAFLDSDEHVAGLDEVGFGAKRPVSRDDLRFAVDERKDFLVRGNHAAERPAGTGIDEGIHRVEKGVAEVNNIGLLEMDIDVGVGVCGREMLERQRLTVGLQFWVVAKVCCGRAPAGEAGKSKLNTGRWCGSDIRFFVFSWARTVAPAACRGPLLSVWSKCQCVSITVLRGGVPKFVSASLRLLQAGARKVSTMILPSGPSRRSTLPPGPLSSVRLSVSLCCEMGTPPIWARIAARRSDAGACCPACS